MFQQARSLGRLEDTTEERAIGGKVTAVERHLLSGDNAPPETGDLSLSAVEQGEEDIAGDWLGPTPQQPQVQAPWRVYEEHMWDHQKFGFSCLPAQIWYAMQGAHGAVDRGNSLFGVAIRGETGPLHRGTFHVAEILPRIHLHVITTLTSGAPINSDNW